MLRLIRVTPFRVSLVAIPLLVLSLLAIACGDDEEEATATPAATTRPAATSPAATTRPAATTAPAATAVTIKAVPVIKWEQNSLTLPAGRATTVTMDNADTGIPHNFAIFKDRAAATAGTAALFKTNICNGPCKENVSVTLQAGDYFFRCDVHPTDMTGSVKVQ